MKKVVIVGGGFGGLYAARAFKRERDVQVTLLDRTNHHLFQPLLYQVATAALSPANIATALRRVLRGQRNVSVQMAEVASVDTAAHRLALSDGGSLEYDFLILATGATHSYFGHPEWEQYATGLKTLEDALTIRRRVLLSYEAAERETDAARRAALLTFIVVGAGPTGVELAGALAEIARHVLASDFRNIDPASARVVLIEAGPRVLPAFTPELSVKAQRKLESMGVQVILGKAVTGIDAEGVTLGGAGFAGDGRRPQAGASIDGERLKSRCALWAAGVQASPLARTLGVPLDKAGRVVVQPDLTVPGAPDAYVIGDLASVPGVPGLAPAAMQEGRYAARAIRARLRGKSVAPFKYLDKGSLATIGRAAAVAEIAGFKLSGLIAWLIWLFVHILTLIGFRNRFVVLTEWAAVYLRYERGARLITFQEAAPLPTANREGARRGEGREKTKQAF